MNNALMQRRFLKSLNTYNENAKIQKKMAEKLFSMLEKKEYDRIFEIGCGTGFLTEIASNNLKYKTYVANDIIPECKNFIQEINSNIEFISCNIEKEINNIKGSYDLIISNAAFQWIDNLQDFIPRLIAKLNPEGIILFSTFGKENFKEIYQTLGLTLQYFSKKELDNILYKYPHLIEEEIHVLAFKNPKNILQHFKLTGVNSLENKAWTKQDILNFEHEYENSCFGASTLTYNPMYVKLFLK